MSGHFVLSAIVVSVAGVLLYLAWTGKIKAEIGFSDSSDGGPPSGSDHSAGMGGFGDGGHGGGADGAGH